MIMKRGKNNINNDNNNKKKEKKISIKKNSNDLWNRIPSRLLPKLTCNKK